MAKVLEVLTGNTFHYFFLRPSTRIHNVYIFSEVLDELLVRKSEIKIKKSNLFYENH